MRRSGIRWNQLSRERVVEREEGGGSGKDGRRVSHVSCGCDGKVEGVAQRAGRRGVPAGKERSDGGVRGLETRAARPQHGAVSTCCAAHVQEHRSGPCIRGEQNRSCRLVFCGFNGAYGCGKSRRSRSERRGGGGSGGGGRVGEGGPSGGPGEVGE